MHHTSDRDIFAACKKGLLTALYPNRCPYCQAVIAPADNACDACRKKLPKTVYRRFAVGGVPCAAALPYTGEYAAAVKRFKFGKKASYARAFAAVALRAALECYDLDSFDIVTSVPMLRQDYRKRRFNHADLLARELAAMADLPYEETLVKLRKNQPQHSLKRNEREKNVRSVFGVTDKSLISGKRILLVDDIITTGNTLGECARILRRGGCRCVDCAVVCTVMF